MHTRRGVVGGKPETLVFRRFRARAVLAGVVAFVACSSSPIELGEVTYPGVPVLHPHAAPPTLPVPSCPTSVRMARAGADEYAAWWSVRADSSAVLMAGRSTDGGATWTAVPADTLDSSRRGCARPAPDITADSATGYVDIAYFLEAKEGPGIFYTHSMDARSLGKGNGIFHSPVAIMYGEHPAQVSVAAAGDRIVVAYEDPNSERPMVGVALSSTMGHIFESRVQATGDDAPARDPIVALSGKQITLQWVERADSAGRGRIALRHAEWPQ